DPALDLDRPLLVAPAALRQARELERLAERDGTRREVADPPELRPVDRDGDDRHVLLDGDHRGAGLGGSGAAGLLTGPFDEQPDDVTVVRRPAHQPHGLAVRLAAADGDRPVPADEAPERRRTNRLDLRDEVDAARREHADERDVDPVQVVDREDETAGRRDAVSPEGPRTRERPGRPAHVAAAERPGELLPGQGVASERARISSWMW